MRPGIARLFDPEPDQWGLRGDPYLWREMAEFFADAPMPASAAELAHGLEGAYQRFTGRRIDACEDVYVPRYCHGGMSSGFVSSEFWRNTGIPLLLSRF